MIISQPPDLNPIKAGGNGEPAPSGRRRLMASKTLRSPLAHRVSQSLKSQSAPRPLVFHFLAIFYLLTFATSVQSLKMGFAHNQCPEVTLVCKHSSGKIYLGNRERSLKILDPFFFVGKMRGSSQFKMFPKSKKVVGMFYLLLKS